MMEEKLSPEKQAVGCDWGIATRPRKAFIIRLWSANGDFLYYVFPDEDVKKLVKAATDFLSDAAYEPEVL